MSIKIVRTEEIEIDDAVLQKGLSMPIGSLLADLDLGNVHLIMVHSKTYLNGIGLVHPKEQSVYSGDKIFISKQLRDERLVASKQQSAKPSQS